MTRLFEIALLRLRSLFRRAGVEAELEREIAFHLHQLTQENIALGMTPEDAKISAKRRLGGPAQIQEECRDMRRTRPLESVWNDLRHAVRTLRKSPSFTIVIVLTMALAIGANSAIFSVVEGVLLRPLPFPRAEQLVRVYFKSDAQPKFPLNPHDFRDFRERNHAFESMAAINRSDAQLSGEGSDPVMVRAFSVTGGYFHMLGVAPARGREFTREDELPKRDRSVILSDRLWRTRFAADPHIIGRTVTVNALPYSVVGVMPAGARHPGNNFHAVADGDTVDLWYPVSFDGNPAERGSHYMDVIGRLKSGVSPAQADADLGAILEQMKKEHTGDGWRVYVTPLYQEMVGSTSRMLLVLLGAVGLLLLIACVNAANLLLARSSARVREVAVRSALGAGRGRIIRQLLTESLVIACAGAGLGTVLAYGGVRALVASLPAGFPRAGEIGLDSTVFAFTLATAVLTGLLFGLVPAIVASRTDLVESLREGGRGATGGGRQLRLRNVLVMSETALACVLLIAAGLMLHSFVNQLQADPGFRSQKVLTASISLPRAHYKSAEARVRFFNRLMTNVESLPGVDSAGGGSDLPWTGYDGNADGFRIEGRSQAYNDKTTARYHIATPGYFRALGIPLLEGRFMNAHDDMTVNPVMLINESMAQRYWPNESALGKRITFRGDPKPKDWIEVIGVIKDIKDKPDSTSIRPAFWMAHAQDPDSALWIAVRGSSESALATQFRLAVKQLDPELAISDQRFMDQITSAALSGQRFSLFLVGLFAALALVLAAIGIYGVISYSVTQRMHEFGMRMALGAKPSDLMRLILGQGLKLALIGLAIGLLAAAGLGQILGSLLYEVNGADPATFAGVAVLAFGTTMLACYIPARRASSADPMRSLRSE